MTTLYVTPAKVYALALPPALLFSTSDVDVPSPLLPGDFTDPARIAGPGSAGPPAFEGNPMGSFSLVLECTTSGRPNQLGVVNPGALPWFRLSCDGGVTFGRSRQLSADDGRGFVTFLHGPTGPGQTGPIGVTVYPQAGSYLVGDRFACTTTPSSDLVALIPPVCDFVDEYLIGSFGDTLPLTAWPGSLEQVVADIVRWRMICKAGLQSREDMQAYHPDKVGATKWLINAQGGMYTNSRAFTPSLRRGTGTASTSFPLLVPGRDPLGGVLI